MSKIAMTKIMITNIFFDEDPYYRDQNDKDLLDKDDEKVCRLWSVPTTIAKTKMMKRLIMVGSKDKGKDIDDEKVDCGRFQRQGQRQR